MQRPRYARLIKGLLLATLFVPAVVLLVPLYVEIVRLPIVHHSLINSYWAVWLPAGASAFNVILVTRASGCGRGAGRRREATIGPAGVVREAAGRITLLAYSRSATVARSISLHE